MHICIDPGSINCGVVILEKGNILFHKNININEALKIEASKNDIVLIETMDSVHGMVGLTTIDTAINIGRLYQYFSNKTPFIHLVGRKYILKTLGCKNDKEVRAKIRLLKPQYKVSTHCWSALSLFLTHE